MNENQTHTDPVMEWLGAYLDGELSEARRASVEAHLANCPACRAELAELRSLTSLLHADPLPAMPHSLQSFTAGVLRRLPSPPRSDTALQRAARYLPLGLFGAWAVVQAGVYVSTILLLGIGYLPGYLADLRGGLAGLLYFGGGLASGWTGWLGEVLSLLGFSFNDGWLIWLVQVSWPGVFVFLELLLAGLFAALFLAWMAGVWSARRAMRRAQ